MSTLSADDLVSRLSETLDELERVATTATKGPWKASDPGEIVGVVRGTEFLVAARVHAWNVAHIARWDPKAVLGLVAAGRELIATHDAAVVKEVDRRESGAIIEAQRHAIGRAQGLFRAIQILAAGFGITEEGDPETLAARLARLGSSGYIKVDKREED